MVPRPTRPLESFLFTSVIPWFKTPVVLPDFYASLRNISTALLSELACFAYARDLLRGKVQESEDDSFGLHTLKLLEINMASTLVPYIQVIFDFEALCKHGRFDLGPCEDKHVIHGGRELRLGRLFR